MILLLLVLLFATPCYAQIEGIVRDANDNELLPFAHVYNLTTSKGTYTDINGFYQIDASRGDELLFSYVGYVKQTITVGNASQIHIKLLPDNYMLNEVVIRAGVNPAHRIINNAIANREKNNPDNLESYSCILYNKLIGDVAIDSTQMRPERYAKMRNDTSSHGVMNEAVVKREYKYKNKLSEHIMASRTSGFKEYQQMAFFQSMLQFFHFYHDVLEWKAPVKFFQNPISPGSTSKYFFLLRDTIVSSADSTFIISYQPRRTTNFEGLKGLLYISSNGWAIQSVVAEPADYSPVRLKIQQQYALMDSVWFPSELSLELFYDNIANQGINIVYRGKSHISELELTPDLSEKRIASRNITMADDAHQRLELIDRYRDTDLSSREEATFRKFKDGSLDVALQLAEGMMDNAALSIKKIDFPMNKIIQQNYYEGFRIGLGMYTNRHLSPWFSLGGYYGYGMNDRKAKYGASFSLFPEKHLDSEVKLWWANDLYQLSLSNEAGVSVRKLWGKFNVETQFMVKDFQTVFDYLYAGRNMTTEWDHNAEVGFRLRYAHNEERAKAFRRTQTVLTTFPVFFLNFSAGIPGFLNSTYQYVKTEAGLERSWYIRNLGTTTFSVWGGWIDRELPFPLMFTITDVEQSLFLTRVPDSRIRFNVLTGDLYASNQYLNFFLYHDFGTLLGKTRSKVFRPRIAVAQSFGWSKLNHPEQHVSADFNILDMHQGYFENGLVIEDIIRIKAFNVFFLGIGGGVYGAYGGSVKKPFEKTLTPKIRLSGSF